ncbi:MAG: GAF sensor-containing diguanylate cyclase [Acidobacteria bacterium OLB17]|nr:MAG: GAF sensor-containing diguanylate cyclase [Acidobacteria bacterium OLB17]
MSFDKTKAMRNAEKYVAQGKIRAAIAEYQSVVAYDPRDITTMNMLGDLHAKTSDRRQAVDCYLKVAEHYATQGFAQKAIAIYNKVARLQPDSIEVSNKLAELYKVKGSLSEARSHYETLAKHYESTGKRIEALAMWKQIALLDPNNTEVCLSLAESYLKEGQSEEAAEAFAEAGSRFSRHSAHEEAIRAYLRSLEIQGDSLRTLDGLIHSYSAIGKAPKAVEYLEKILEKEPYNRDILYLLIDCHIDSGNAAGAERAVLKLVEIEPANYPKLLDLVRIYLNTNDLDSAARILSMSSEYLLAAGQGEDCERWINEILERDPSHVPALRLLVRYCSWIKDEEAFRVSLERLAVSARAANEVDDERSALAQLVIVRPFETQFSERLAELRELHGFTDEPVDAELLRAGFDLPKKAVEQVAVEEPAAIAVEACMVEPQDAMAVEVGPAAEGPDARPAAVDELKLQKDLESINFYIENEYSELAAKAIEELESEFGRGRR